MLASSLKPRAWYASSAFTHCGLQLSSTCVGQRRARRRLSGTARGGGGNEKGSLVGSPIGVTRHRRLLSGSCAPCGRAAACARSQASAHLLLGVHRVGHLWSLAVGEVCALRAVSAGRQDTRDATRREWTHTCVFPSDLRRRNATCDGRLGCQRGSARVQAALRRGSVRAWTCATRGAPRHCLPPRGEVYTGRRGCSA